MKNYHICGIVFFTGVIMAAAILPAHAMPVSMEYSSKDTAIESIDDETNTVTMENGTVYDVDGDELDKLEEGDSVEVFERGSFTTIYDTSNGNEVYAN